MMASIPITLTDALSKCAGLTLFCCGNPSRGDDGIGPWIAQKLRSDPLQGIEIIEDFQWQIEHSLDFNNDKIALFVDAAVNQTQPLCLVPVIADPSPGHSTHALTPAQLLSVCNRPGIPRPAAAWQLSLAAEWFELGTEISPQLLRRGEEAVALIQQMANQLSRAYSR